jgi:hypothetical protein
MRQPNREEYKQLKRQGFSIKPLCKVWPFWDKTLKNEEWKNNYLMKNNTVLVGVSKGNLTVFSLNYLYEKGVLT